MLFFNKKAVHIYVYKNHACCYNTAKLKSADNVRFQKNKNIVRHTAHTIVSWPNPKQWLMILKSFSKLATAMHMPLHGDNYWGVVREE